MSFGGFILTNLGRQELAKAEMGQQLVFDYVAVGDGSSSGSAAALDALSHELYRLPILSVSRDGDTVIVDAELSNDKLEAGFYFREIGLFANGVLYAYDNAGQDAEYIDAAGSAVAKLKRIRIALKLSSAAGVMVKMEPGLYALYSDLRDANAEIEELKEGKVDKVEGKGLSANDYTDAEKEKLAGVAAGAEVNVQADWDAADTGSDAFIKNKPVIPTVPAALKNPQALTFTGGVTGSYDGSSAKSVAIPAAGTTSPKVAGTASAGTAATFSRSDHVHPLQTSVSGSSGSCTGNAASATKAMQDGNGKVIASTYLPLAGGTLTGNLTVKNGTSNYGSKINLGDGDYVHISEPTDDCMEIKAKKVNFVISDTTDSAFTINGTKLLRSTDTAASAIKATQDGNGNVISSTYATKGIVIAEGSFRPAGGECRFSIPSNALHTLANYDGSMSYMEKNYLAGKYVVLRIIGVIYGKGSFVQDVFLLVPEGVNPDVNHYDYSCKVYPRYDNSVSSEYLTLSTSLSYILSVSGSGTNIYIYSITAF